MALEKILVVHADEEWQDVVGKRLPEIFPESQVEYVENMLYAAGMATVGKYDLYLIAAEVSPEAFERGVQSLRSAHEGARVVLLTADTKSSEKLLNKLNVNLVGEQGDWQADLQKLYSGSG